MNIVILTAGDGVSCNYNGTPAGDPSPGNTGKTPLQETVEWAREAIGTEGKLFVAGCREQENELQEQLAAAGCREALLLCPPSGCGNALTMGLAAWLLERQGGDPIIAFIPINLPPALREKIPELLAGGKTAAKKYGLVTFGLRPTSPQCGYGYLFCDRKLDDISYRVENYFSGANRNELDFLRNPRLLQHSGIVVARLKELVKAFRTHLPELARLLDQVDLQNPAALEVTDSPGQKLSFENGILEKSASVAAIPVALDQNRPENRTPDRGNKPAWELTYRQWLTNASLDGDSKKELLSLAGKAEDIRDRFETQLEFGTGGLRGVMGAGTNRMNRYVIRRTTQGLANFLNEQYPPDQEKKVVIAYDSRYNSRQFAEETARVAAGNGIKALLFREMRPTPELSFAVRELGCQAGVVITASHNPPQYNGFKVYGEDGGQAATELAGQLAAAIDRVDYFNDIRLISPEEAQKRGLWEYIEDSFDDRYLEKIKSLSFIPGDENLKIVYTPLHGTGIFLIPRLLQELGYKHVYVVEKQAAPDPAFSTVGYPNPEEKKSFELALGLAEAHDADLVLATDPDADRVGCAVKDSPGGYTLLNGNQVGALLLEYLLGQLKRNNRLPPNGVMIKTIVTGNLGKKIAASYGVETMETLTGFKYIGEKMKEFESTGSHQFLFGYEESYGYLAGTFVRDKDSVIASALLAEMTAYYKQQGKSVPAVLEGLYQKHGYYLEDLQSVQLANTAQAAEILRAFRDEPLEIIGGMKIEEIRDYKLGRYFRPSGGGEGKLLLPRSDVLYFALEGESWFSIRPSGTEPKIKFYFSVTAASKKEATTRLAALKSDVLTRGTHDK